MKLLMKVLTVVVSAATVIKAAPLRGSVFKRESFVEKKVKESDATRDFVPLSCNREGYGICRPWSRVFGTLPIHTATLVIPCGKCVVLDLPMVALFGGIDIQGKLLVEGGPDHIIQTTHIVVQGELEMKSEGPINGDAPVRIILIGEENQSFIPIDDNAEVCDGKVCDIGSKAIVVAGGTLNIRGISDDAPTWLIAQNATKTSITLPASAFNHWTEGSEIVIATHSDHWDENQVRRITKAQRISGKLVNFELDAEIEIPTLATNSPDFATEVALLSRNVVIQGGYTSQPVQGGHLQIMQTPLVNQTLVGVDFQRFGQQGRLGRYPIHLHFCGDSTGTVVAKNTVRHSNQRCIVVHGTNNLEIRENVAYDTKGHCFMLEDGMEIGNSFIRNIGIQTSAPTNVIPDYGFNGKESDSEPSTFWITNPANNWIGNVVAGSESSGFWFELLVRGERGHQYGHVDPKREKLGVFVNNTVHSCAGRALRTYPSGYIPDREASFVGVKAYLNRHTGVFFHNSKNLKVTNSLFADNRISMDIDKADSVKVRRSSFIGQSDSFLNLLTSRNIPNNCHRNSGRTIGLQLHTARNDHQQEGAEIEKVSFSKFDRHPCDDSVAIHIDHSVRYSYFDYISVFESTRMDKTDGAFDFCDAVLSGINDTYVVDSDGSLSEDSQHKFGTIISDHSEMTRFTNPEMKCQRFKERCYQYCSGLCLRTIRYETNPAISDSILLRVCEVGTNNCFSYDGVASTDSLNLGKRRRFFNAHLPPGHYEAEFVDNNGIRVWPSFVDVHRERNFCPVDQRLELELLYPMTKTMCNELTTNGDFSLSSTEATHWLYRSDEGVSLEANAGNNGTPALVSGFNDRTTVGQYLDNRCFKTMVGRTYRVRAAVAFIDRTEKPLVCESGSNCAFIGFTTRHGGFVNIGRVLDVPMIDGFYIFEGDVTMDGSLGVDDQVFFYIDAIRPHSRLIVDHVSIFLVQG